MKQDWDIKKLGEVCEVICGQDYKAVKDDNGKYPIYGTGGVMGYASQYRCPSNSVIIGRKDSINNPLFVETEFWNVDTAFGVVPNKEMLCPKFFFLFCKSFDFTRLDVSVTIPSLRRVDILQIPIPVPPLPVQEQIVSELDLLSGIIEKKREQLKELDALAQSIFYDMFGDPITNEKGWEVKKLEQVSTLLNGRAYKQNELLDSGKYKVLRVGNFFTNSSYYYSDLELEEDKYCDNGDLLFAWSASFGAFIWNGGKVIYHYHIWKVLYDNKQLNIDYYRFLLNTMTTYFMKDVHGIGMVHLTKVGMEQYMLPIPPLPLQHQFASKIEAIERQKELIKQSISETETLFNARMQEHFG